MSAQPEWLQLNAFVDGELDLERQLEIEALVREDVTLGAQVGRLRRLREAMSGGAHYHAAPAALHKRMHMLVSAQASASARAGLGSRWSAARSAVHRWLAWRPFVSALGITALLAVVLNIALLPAQHESRLEQEVIASHVRATLAQRLVDVASSDHHTVKPWLSSKLDFSPPVTEPAASASRLVGGRVDYLDGRPVAALVYQRAGHVVDSFVWPLEQANHGVVISSQRGFNLAHWSRNGMVHWVISDLNPSEFAELVRELHASD